MFDFELSIGERGEKRVGSVSIYQLFLHVLNNFSEVAYCARATILLRAHSPVVNTDVINQAGEVSAWFHSFACADA